MRNLHLLLFALFGLLFNMSFTGTWVLPDWCLSILLASLLSYRQSFLWVLPCVLFHDMVLYYSAWTSLPYFLLLTVALISFDQHLGQGQPQRWLTAFVGCVSLFMAGANIWSCLLTMTLSVMLWSWLSYQREKAYVEPA